MFSSEQQDSRHQEVSETMESESKRPNTLTEKGQTYFRERLDHNLNRLSKVGSDIDNIIKGEVPQALDDVQKLESSLRRVFANYVDLSCELLEFLSGYNTQESESTYQNILALKDSYHMKVSDFSKGIENVIHELAQPKSTEQSTSPSKSCKSRSAAKSSRSSTRSSASTVLGRQRAKLDGAKAKLRFAEKEAAMKREAALLNVKMELLEAEKEVAVASAEYTGMKEELYDDSQSDHENENKSDVMNRYFDSMIQTGVSQPDIQPPHSQPNIQPPHSQPIIQPPYIASHPSNVVYTSAVTAPITSTVDHVTNNNSTPNVPSPELNDFSTYLLKRDILPLRVIEFDDRAETYAAWKISFNTFKTELKSSSREELDLLIKYLGTKSREHALSIKSANANCSARAVELIWKRLDERYGSPVLLEASLKARIDKFPQLTPKDNARLYDLADLLVEIQSRMEDPSYQRSLSCFDSSTCMRPIVSKLPFCLQEKWTSRASSYNARHQVTYPPFTFLVEFVNEMSRIRNDPGFNYQSTLRSSNTPSRNNPNVPKGRELLHRRENVSVKKTDLIKDSQQCMLHDTKHSLNQCKTFQKLTLNERKKLLKDYKYCFKCCSSTQHTYKSCQVSVKCDMCGSVNHATALHIDRNKDRESTTVKTLVEPEQDHGGEESHVSKCMWFVVKTSMEDHVPKHV